MICPSCQKEIADNSRFCYLCGARLGAPAAAPQTAPGAGPRRLYRSATDRKLGGVCGGVAEYLEVDPTIIRVLLVLCLFTGIGIVAYFVAWVVIPLGPEPFPGSAAPAAPARRLRRSVTDKKLGGVCAGVADYLGLDATIVRVIWLCFVFVGGFGFFSYLLLWFILPLEDVPSASFSAAAGNPSR